MKRLSVTLLDSFRLYREADWFTLDMMMERITGEFVATREMDIGTALHKCIEDDCWWSEVNGRRYEFGPQDLATFIMNLPDNMIHELKLAYDFGPAQVSGIVDGICGNWIFDHKTSFKPFQLEKYQSSYQWRFYLEMFGCDVFQYNFAQLREEDGGEFGNGYFRIVNSHFIPLARYPGMDNDTRELVEDFMVFAERQGVVDYLKDAQPEAA